MTRTPVAEPAHALGLHPWGRTFAIVALLLLVIAAGLRLYHLGARSLWYDEAATADASRGTLAQTLEETRHFSAPIAHPYILYLVEKEESNPVAVRMPSVLASILAVLLMLAMTRAGIHPLACIFAATILTFSATQIRYAQEVREYSLSILVAAILIYLCLRSEAAGHRDRQPWLLYFSLFLAPLVQYGLVLLSAAILATILIRLFSTPETRFRAIHLAGATASLGLGCAASFLLTLRYQFHAGGVQWYLVADFLDPKQSNLLWFLIRAFIELLRFIAPGRPLDFLIVLCVAVVCIIEIRRHSIHPALLLTLLSIGITMGAAIIRVYPFGGVRQCLFLAPGIALSAGIAFADLLQRIEMPLRRNAATVAVMVVIVVTLYHSTLRMKPYSEYEDIQSVLNTLNHGLMPHDQVWVNHDAVPAVRFYRPTVDSRFWYGKYHDDAAEYIPELQRFVDPQTKRVWLIFSHLQQARDREEEQLIVNSLRSGWDVHTVAAPTNTELDVASRRAR